MLVVELMIRMGSRFAGNQSLRRRLTASSRWKMSRERGSSPPTHPLYWHYPSSSGPSFSSNSAVVVAVVVVDVFVAIAVGKVAFETTRGCRDADVDCGLTAVAFLTNHSYQGNRLGHLR